MKRLILLFCLSIFLHSCSTSSTPNGVLPPEQMKAVLKDMHLADAYLSTLADTLPLKKYPGKLYQNVFKKHHTSLKEFNASLGFYARKPTVLDSMYKQIYDDLTKVGRNKIAPKAVE
ncbi:MAG: DUF4296 domain-containing protein [Sphingobacteriaceae bacterium]